MQNCKEIQALFSEYIDAALDAQKQQQVQAHIGQCTACKKELEKLRTLTGMLSNLKKDEPPADFLDRLNSRIHKRRSLDKVLKDILNSPNVKVPVTLSVVAVFLFVVAEHILKPYYLAQHHYTTQSANDIGEQYSPGLTREGQVNAVRTQRAEEEAKKGYAGKTITGGHQQTQKTTDSRPLSKEQWPAIASRSREAGSLKAESASPAAEEKNLNFVHLHNLEQNSADHAAINAFEPGKDFKVYTSARNKLETSVSEGKSAASAIPAQMSVGGGGVTSDKQVNKEGVLNHTDEISFVDSEKAKVASTNAIIISVDNVAASIERVKTILKKYGIEQSFAQTGSTTQNMIFTVTVPVAVRAALVEELSKLSTENVLVSLSPTTAQDTCFLSIQLRQTFTGDASADFMHSGQSNNSAGYSAGTVQ